MNYKEEYNVFWNGNNRFGEKSFVSAEKVVSEIISVFGRGSVLGNPFKMETEADRDMVCDAYDAWFREQIKAQNEAICNELFRLMDIAKNGTLILGCFCAPKRCHGQTIKACLEQWIRQEKEVNHV